MNLIFTAFATLEGYREGSNANLGSEVFYRCIVVSLVSAKQKNQNCDAALVTNTAVPEPYAAQLSRAGIRVIACPFDNYRFEADLDWSLAYYKLCAMQYLLETEHYENYLMLDSDTFTQRGYQDIWREAAEAVLLYQVPHAASQPMTARISHTYDELWPEGAPHVLTHFGGEFVAGSTARLQDFMAECRNVFDRMQQTGVRSQDGDEAILDAAAYRSQLAGKPVRAANAYVFRYWLGGHFYYVSTNYCCDPVCVLQHCTAARAGHPPPCRRQPQGCEAAGQRAQQQGPLVLHNSGVHHAGAAQRHHSLCRRQRGDAPEAVFSGHLHQSALPHPADLRGRQLYAGGQLAVHRADRHCAVQLCGDSVLQPHKIHRVGT